MRIAVLASHFPPSGGGGVTSAQANLAWALHHRGLETQVFTFLDSPQISFLGDPDWVTRGGAPSLTRKLLKTGVTLPIKIFSLGKKAYQSADIFEAFLAAPAMEREIAEFEPDWIIAADQCAPTLGLKLPERSKLALVFHHWAPRFLSLSGRMVHSWIDAELAKFLTLKAAAQATAWVVPSQAMKNAIAPWGKDREIHVIPNLISNHAPASEVNQGKASMKNLLRICIPGGGNPMKGAEQILAFLRELGAKHPGPLEVLITGSISEALRQELQSSVPQHLQLLIPGALPYELNRAQMAQCDLLVTPTRLESFGMAILEGFSLGLPAVAYPADAIPEIVRNEETGLLAELNEPRSLAEQTLALLTQNEKRVQFSKNAKKLVEEHYSEKVVTDQWLRLFQQ